MSFISTVSLSFKVKLTEWPVAAEHLELDQRCKFHHHHSLYRKGSTKKEFYLVKSPVTHKIYTVMITPSQADTYRRRNYEVIKI